MGPMNRIENELQPGLKDMAETTMNGEFGGSNLQQQLRNGAGQLNMQGDGRVPMFSGSLPMVTNSQQPPTMQTDGPPRAPNFAETNLPKGVNPNTPLMLPPPGQNGRRPLLQMNKQTINPQLPLSNQQNSMNSALNPPYTQYSSQMPQRQGLPILQHFPRLPPNYLAPGKLPMDQQMQRLYPHPYYPNGNADNGYEGQTLSNSPVYPDQSTSNFNIGDMLQQPTNMFESFDAVEYNAVCPEADGHAIHHGRQAWQVHPGSKGGRGHRVEGCSWHNT
ncbi:unnamed protein product [Aphis gossypii]|uniref:Uncharacterized protein n=1 Tax=Aphis gossypii TaxID=80765 RepID=A0A9P0NR93_APHGO|nr:unnamed protein product [Aphis gossypii]